MKGDIIMDNLNQSHTESTISSQLEKAKRFADYIKSGEPLLKISADKNFMRLVLKWTGSI